MKKSLGQLLNYKKHYLLQYKSANTVGKRILKQHIKKLNFYIITLLIKEKERKSVLNIYQKETETCK